MVDFDLRKLSAPIEALRSELSKAYKRLDEQWDEIAQCLRALPIPCSVSYTYCRDPWAPENFSCLVWKKWNGKKRVCIEDHIFNPNEAYSEYEVNTTPYEEWSGEQRIEMLQHVPGLFAAAEVETKEFIDKTKN